MARSGLLHSGADPCWVACSIPCPTESYRFFEGWNLHMAHTGLGEDSKVGQRQRQANGSRLMPANPSMFGDRCFLKDSMCGGQMVFKKREASEESLKPELSFPYSREWGE